jgi:hypothetical protein
MVLSSHFLCESVVKETVYFCLRKSTQATKPLLGAGNTKARWVGYSIRFCTNNASAPVQEMPVLCDTELSTSITCRNHGASLIETQGFVHWGFKQTVLFAKMKKKRKNTRVTPTLWFGAIDTKLLFGKFGHRC